jgi:hypothetical protein
VITYFSQPVAPHHQKLPAYERKLIGLIKAVQHWWPYIWGRTFTVRTDHYILKFLLDQRLSTIPQHMWVSKLFGYDLMVEYTLGKLNGAADALSHREEDIAVVQAISTSTFVLFNQLWVELQQNSEAVALHNQLVAGTAPKDWSLVDDLVLFKGKIFIPEACTLWPELLSYAHSGHEGVQKKVMHWRGSFYSPHALRHVQEFVQGCAVCQRNKSEHLHLAGLLQPLLVPSQVWSDISMDFIEGFPKVGSKPVVLTVVDRFSKFTHFIVLGHPYSAASMAKAFF